MARCALVMALACLLALFGAAPASAWSVMGWGRDDRRLTASYEPPASPAPETPSPAKSPEYEENSPGVHGCFMLACSASGV